MERVWTLLLFGVGLVLVALPLVMARECPWLLLLLPMGAWALHVSGKRDARRVEDDLAQRQIKVQEAQTRLTNTPLKTDEVMTVKSDSHIWLAGLGIVAGGLFFDVSAHPIMKLLLIVLAILFLFMLVIGFGKPRLEVDAKGFRTPLHGHIPWSAVDGIDLKITKTSYKGASSFHYVLHFLIGDYTRAVAVVPKTVKVLSLLGTGPIITKTVSVYLGRASKESDQETIYGIARSLWQQSRIGVGNMAVRSS